MKRLMLLAALLSMFTAVAFAHAGEVHTYMGTVTMLHPAGEFMMKTSTGKVLIVETAKATVYLHADGKPAKVAELVPGRRIVLTMSKDGKTATQVKLGAMAK